MHMRYFIIIVYLKQIIPHNRSLVSEKC